MKDVGDTALFRLGRLRIAISNERSHRVTSLSAASTHTCAVAASGRVSCWGHNDTGQLGDGTRLTSAVPVPVKVGVAVSVRAGDDFSCSIDVSGRINCWGDKREPFEISGIGPAVDVASTRYLICALERSHQVRCKQPSTATEASSTYTVRAPEDAVGIATTHGQVCLVREHGELACFLNEHWMPWSLQSDPMPAVEARPLEAITHVRQLVGDFNDFCAVFDDGRVGCWPGLRDGSVAMPALKYITGITSATSVAIRLGHGCALERNGQAKCWGYNVGGVLGSDEDPATREIAVPVTAVSTADQITTGNDFSCASQGAKVFCWGSTGYGVLGSGERAEAVTPREVVGIAGATQVVAGDGYSCALTGAGVWCWGGARRVSLKSRPQPVHLAHLDGAERLTMHDRTVCSYKASRILGCVREPSGDPDNFVSFVPRGLDNARVFYPQRDNVGIALSKSGKLVLHVDYAGVSSVTAAKGIEDAVDLDGDEDFSCAVLRSGKVVCADTTRWSAPEVRQVPAIHDARSISYSIRGDSCAVVTKTGKLVMFHPFTTYTTRVPQLVQSLVVESFSSDILSVSVGGLFKKCALLKSGQVTCTGFKFPDELDPEQKTQWQLNNWSLVEGISNAVSIASGSEHACAVLKDGRVVCWGLNSAYELGSGPVPFTTKGTEVVGLEL